MPHCDPVEAVAAAGSSDVAVVSVEPTAAKRRKVSVPQEAASFYFSHCDLMKRTKGWGACARKIFT